jgi:hypothetical protein
MTQSDNAPVEITPPEGDLDTAIWFGEYIAGVLYRLNCAEKEKAQKVNSEAFYSFILCIKLFMH